MRSLRLFTALVLIAAAAHASDRLVSTDWLQSHLRDRDVAVVEVGDRAAFLEGHIPGARFLALTDIAVTRNGLPNELPEFDQLAKVMSAAGVPDHGRIVLYGRDVIAAARAFMTLDALGCAYDAALLDGGWTKWSAEKRPVASGAPDKKTTIFEPCPHPDLVIGLNAMRMLVNAAYANPSSVAIVDARPDVQFWGKEAGAGVEHPGHIAHAINVAWNENLTSSVTPQFRTFDDLREIYRKAGVEDRASVIVYCRTGMQASVDYFVLRALGREVYLYDGGYIEWNAAKGTMVEKALP